MDEASVVLSQGRWTEESIGRLPSPDVHQLRDNAQRRGAREVVAICEAVLASRSREPEQAGAPPTVRRKNLIPRRTAFELRGVPMGVGMASWSGIARKDGKVVFALWAEHVRSDAAGCSYLLWAPNEEGVRRWSDSPAGVERREHCLRAMESGSADAFLVFGVREEGFLPQERARTISGVDPDISITLCVVRRGGALWGVWGAKAQASWGGRAEGA